MQNRRSLRNRALLVACAAMGLAAIGVSSGVRAGVIVNDSWSDGTRTDPASPTYSENGVDTDTDGNIESAWYTSPTAAMTASVGHLITTQQTGSSSYTTYFTPEAGPVTLANAGDQIKVTYAFTPTGINSTSTSQGLRFGLVDSPAASRLTADGAPGTPAVGSQYTGYALFASMRTGTLGNGNSFQILKRADTTAAPAAFLSASAAWTGIANGANTTTPGYTEGAADTLVMTVTRNAANGLDIVATMTGAGLGTGNQGFVTVSGTDASPLGYTFDMLGLRPSTAADTATTFDVTNFKVEFNSVPEPASLALLGLSGLAMLRRRRAQ
jgi:hypothetical protein